MNNAGAPHVQRKSLFLKERGRAAPDFSDYATVIPAKAGIHRQYEAWIPAFAGMTTRLFAAICHSVTHGFLLEKKSHKNAVIHQKPAARHAAGFTLFEVLGAMALLALLLLGVYSGVRSATHTVQAGTIKIEQLDEVRSAQQFLRRELAQAMAQSMGMDSNGNGIFFVGTADSMRFVAPLPGYLGRMGPQLVEVKLVKGEHGKQLVASLAVLPPNGDKPKPLGDPQVLLDGVIDGSFSYRGVNQQGQPLDWQNDWNTAAAMPNLVVIKLALGKDRPWPMLSVPLRVNAAALQGPGNLLRGLRGPGVGP